MTHDERRLLCLVARHLTIDQDPELKAWVRETNMLVVAVQRHAAIENGKAAKRLVRGLDRVLRSA